MPVPDPARRRGLLLALGGFLLAAAALAPSLAGRTAFAPADYWLYTVPFALAAPPELRAFPTNTLLGDTALIYLPQLWVVREALAEGTFPLWNRYFGCGEPLLGAGLSSPASPVTLPVLLLPWPLGFAWSAVLRFGLMWAGAYLYARSMRLARSWSTCVAIGFCFTPLFIVHFQQYPRVHAHVWLPWLLWSVERLARATPAGARALVRAALPIPFFEAAALVAGYVPASFNVTLAAAAYLVVRLPWRPARLAASGRAVGLAALGLGALLAAPVLVPLLDLLLHSAMFADRVGGSGGAWVLPAESLRLYWDPYALGSPLVGAARPWSGVENFEEEQQYVGLLPWVFLALAAPRLRRLSRDDALRVAALAPLALACAALAYGWEPFHRWATAVPPFSFNSNPRLLLVTHVAIVVLAALAARGWPQAPAGARPRPAAPWALLALVGVGAGALVALAPAEHGTLRPWVALASAALLYAAGRFAVSAGERRAAAALVPLLLLADLAPVYHRYHPQVPSAWADPARARRVLPAALADDPHPRAAFERMVGPNLPAVFGVEDVRAYNPPMPLRYDAYMREVMGLAAPVNLLPEDLVRPEVIAGLERTCAGWLLTSFAYEAPLSDRLELVWQHRDRLYLHRLRGAAPCAAWHPADEVASVASLPDAVVRVRDALRLPVEPIVVERPGEGRAAAAPPAPGLPAAARFATANQIVVEAPADAEGREGLLVLRVSFDPGWSASSETGAPLRVLPAQVRFLAVEAPAGTRRVVLRYAPPHFGAAWVLAGVGLLAVAAALAWSRRD